MKYVRIINGRIDTETIAEAEDLESARQELLDSDDIGVSDSFDVIEVDEIIESAKILSKEENISKWKCPECGGITGIKRENNLIICKDCKKPIGIGCTFED